MGIQKKARLYTGSYNVPVLTGDGSIYHGKGGGIRVFLFDEEDGTLESSETYPDVENASWMAFSPDRKTLYAVNELDDYEGTAGGSLSALAVDEKGKVALRNRLPVMGAAPCHVSCDRSGGHVFTANYNGGSLSSFALDGDGSLREMDLQIIHHLAEGDRPCGIDEIRQEKPHVHSASVFKGSLWVTDLGTDEISVYELDGAGNIMGRTEDDTPRACCKVTLPAGSGPRSLAFREDGHVYVSCELSDKIGILYREGDGIKIEGSVSCLPREGTVDGKGQGPEGRMQRDNLPGGILLSGDGKYLYIGNRGHDSIGVFRLDGSGLAQGIQWISSGGRNPRGFQLSPSGRWLIAANQDSDNLVVFRRDEEKGTLKERGRYGADAVVCLEFL